MEKPAARLLEVFASLSAPLRWKWSDADGEVEIACGYETSRETAQVSGDDALFVLFFIDPK